MKVLHLISGLSAGGAELHLLTLCKHLRREGIQVSVAHLVDDAGANRPLRSDFEALGIPVYSLRAAGLHDVGCLIRTIRLVTALRPDILHSHLPVPDLAAAVCSWFVPDVKWISSVHSHYDDTWSRSWALPILKLAWLRVDRIVAISHELKSWLLRRLGIPESKVVVVHYGIELKRFIGADPTMRGSQTVIGSIGRLMGGKRHDELIRSMPLVLREVPSAKLLIAGHDVNGYERVLRELIEELGLENSVQLVGFKADIPAFLDTIDVFALASVSEGFGQVIIEAMASGRPVVAMKVPPMTEIVKDGESGCLVDAEGTALAGALVDLLRDSSRRISMGLAGRAGVQKYFAAEHMAEQILEVYRDVVVTPG